MSAPHRHRSRWKSLQPWALVWLTVLWVALWGDVSIANVVAGIVVGTVVCLAFPLPPLRMHLRIRPHWLAWLVVRFLADVVLASIQVARTTLAFGRQPKNAVIEIDLRTDSDFVLTVVAEMVSLVPGSLVVEARRSTHTLFLHVLDARDKDGVERMRREVMALERRVVLAFGADTAPVLEPEPLPVGPHDREEEEAP